MSEGMLVACFLHAQAFHTPPVWLQDHEFVACTQASAGPMLYAAWGNGTIVSVALPATTQLQVRTHARQHGPHLTSRH